MKKILLVHLLRLGDILMHAKIPRLLKEKYPDCEIHMLMNSQFKNACNLLSDIDSFHFFDRKKYQKLIANYETPIFTPVEYLETWLEELNEEGFETIINLSQNKLSGWVVGAIEAKQKIGMQLGRDASVQFSSPWLEYLNNYPSRQVSTGFHYSDIFLNALELKDDLVTHGLEETLAGKKEAAPYANKNQVCIQAFTSDRKKEWPMDYWAESLELLSQMHPMASFILLAAPDEKERADDLKSLCHDKNVLLEVCVCSLEAAYSILLQSDLLITLDTSIKHLAAHTDIEILELCLGSGDSRQTGVYRDNAYIIEPKTSCFPCAHSEKCSQKSFVCGESIEPDIIAVTAKKLLEKTYLEVETVAREFSDEVNIYKTLCSHSGFWSLINLSEKEAFKELSKIIESSSWKLFLKREHKKIIGNYSSESSKIKATLQNIFPNMEMNEILEVIQNEILHFEEDMNRFDLLNESLNRYVKAGEAESLLWDIQSQSKGALDNYSGLIKEALLKGRGRLDFITLRKLQKDFTSGFEKNKIKVKLLRALKTQMMEVI